jgi:RNA polymerase sigma-70 factor (ECF subfamily)
MRLDRLKAESLGSALEISDDEVVRRVRAGEGALFEVVMRRYNARLFRLARAILRDDAEAEDAVQQAYVNAYLHLGQFEGRASFATWLTRIAVYEASGRARKRARSPLTSGEDTLGGDGSGGRDPSLDPEQSVLVSELGRVLECAIDGLSEAHRVVFVMRQVEGLSTAETAHCLGVSADVVKTRMTRARQRLRETLLEQWDLAAPHVFEFHLSRCDRVVDTVYAQLSAVRTWVH